MGSCRFQGYYRKINETDSGSPILFSTTMTVTLHEKDFICVKQILIIYMIKLQISLTLEYTNNELMMFLSIISL